MADHATSITGVALRVAKLGADGKPVVGPKASYVTSSFMRFGWSAEYTAGDEIEEKAANGDVCAYLQQPDVLKRVTFSLAICDPSPELHEMLIGGTILLPETGSDPVGYAGPASGVDSNPYGVAFEVFSQAIVAGRPAPTLPYWRWVFPFAKMKLTGDRVLENGLLANEFEGYGLGNLSYGRGAAGDWPYQTDRAFAYVRSATAPTGINDYVPVAAPPAPTPEVQTVTLPTGLTAGTFTLQFAGYVTTPLQYNATAVEVKNALANLPSVAGPNNVDVTKAGDVFTVTFQGALAGVNVPSLVGEATGFTPTGAITVATTTQGE